MDTSMQKALVIAATPKKDGHFVSPIQLLELLIPYWMSMPEEDDENHGVNEPNSAFFRSVQDMDNGKGYICVDFTFDGRSRNALSFLSMFLMVRHPGFQTTWQSPDNVFQVICP